MSSASDEDSFNPATVPDPVTEGDNTIFAESDVVAAPQGFGERFSNSFGAILFGLLLVPLSCWGLFWNEGRAVKTARALSEGLSLVVPASPDRLNSALDGKLVHIAGPGSSQTGVADAAFGVQGKGLKLARRVEMYQWKQTESGSGQDRKFTYSREWSESPIQSSRFHAPSGHQNPAFPVYRSQKFGAADARVGQFPVGETAALRLDAKEAFPITDAGLGATQRTTGRVTRVNGGGYYIGSDPLSPRVGDVRITYMIKREGPVSFVGRQQPEGLQPYRATNGQEFLLASSGIESADTLFQTAQDDNRTLTWVLRAVGLVVMLIGFSALFAPVTLLASYIPILGSLVSGAVFLVSLAATVMVGTSVIAIAWFVYRPLLSLALVAAAIAITFGLRQLRKQRQAARMTPGGFAPRPN